MRRSLVNFVGLSLLALSSCSDPAEPSAPQAPPLSEKLSELGARIGATSANLKSSATTPVTIAPADLTPVARLAASATGGTDIVAEQTGKRGEKAVDIDGAGGDDAVTIFVPDPPTGGTSTTASSPSFLAWQGADDGLCYLAWSRGASWFVISKCGDASGAWVCSATSGGAACDACSTAGECSPCDLDQATFTCAW